MISSDNIKIKLSPLSPTSSADGDGHYESVIEFALNDSSIKNIAVTGRYGAGKSSVIQTFIRRKIGKWNVLNISLASFVNEKQSQSGADIQAIERSILQQIFYTVRQETIPLSRFKRIVSSPKSDLHKKVIFVAIFVWSLMFLIVEQKIKDSLPNFASWYVVLNYLIAISFGYATIISTVNYMINLKELKLKLHDAEIHIGEGSAKSILNDHLDEILYFFESTEYDVVVIEDLDRFEKIEIFTRLRELNSVINNAAQVGRIVKFVYAIKDDLLSMENRTKFFDFIIPIIPTINPNNAYEHIRMEYPEVPMNDQFLAQVSLHFDDLRLVRNIFNEFHIYLSKIGGSISSFEKLFAMIVYKNFDPKDFSQLHSNRGKLFTVFSVTKNLLIEAAEASVIEKINILINEEFEIDREKAVSIDELNRIYSSPVLQLIQDVYYINHNSVQPRIVVDGEGFLFEQLLLKENFEKFVESSNIEIVMSRGVSKRTSFLELERIVGGNVSYKQRRDRIVARVLGKKQEIEKHIQELKLERERIQHLSFSALAQNFDATIDWPEGIHSILMFLTINGFIDENYPDLISYFFESTISQRDKEFAIRVNNGGDPKFDFKLEKIAELIDRYIGIHNFGKRSTLNFDLMDFLMSSPRNEYDQERRLLVRQLTSLDAISLRFIVDYINRGNYLDKFFQAIYTVESGMIGAIISNDNSDNKSVIMKTLCNLDPQVVAGGGGELDNVRSFMQGSPVIVKLLWEKWSSHSTILTQWILLVKPMLENLTASHAERHVVDILLTNNCVYVNKSNVDTLANIYIEDKSWIKQRPFSAFLNSGQVLRDHCLSHIDQYSECILSGVDLLNEPQDLMMAMLNEKDISLGARFLVVDKMGCSITNLSLIDDNQVRGHLMSRIKVDPTWHNLFLYFNESSEIDETFAEFFNDEVNRRSLSEEDFDIDDERRAEFELAIITSQLIKDETINLIASKLEYEFSELDLGELSEARIRSLVSAGVIELSDAHLEQIRSIDTQLLKLFLGENIDRLILPEGIYTFKASDYEVVLQGCTDSLIVHKILIGGAYDFIPDSKKLQEIALNNYDKGSIPEKIFESVYFSCDIDDKIILITEYADFFARDKIKKLVEDLSDETSALFSSEAILQLSNTELHRKFANILYDKGFIVKPKLKGSGYFKVLEIKARKR